MQPFDLSVLFFLQLAIILGVCRVVGMLARLIGQPQVVGEMIAGVLLGPSLLGLFWPEFQATIFPKESKPLLFATSQVGLSLYMFIVGVEFRVDHFHAKASTAIRVSLAGMLTPFFLGAVLAYWMYQQTGFFKPEVRLFEGVLFLGASMCITAFPMLARIIVENRLSGTALGTLALAAGAIDDVAAWTLLAIVLASFTAAWSGAALTIGGGILYAVTVLVLLRPILRSLFRERGDSPREISPAQLVLVLALVCLGSYCTDKIGVYAVFGAFLMGCAMPRGWFSEELQKKIEPLTVALLLPLFFTYSGLNTRLDLVDSPYLIGVAIVVLAAASVGKGVACWLAARLGGEDNPTAMAIGALMNARGLMELIMLNIGRDRGIIGDELFSIMVLMAIITTLIATPIFRFVYPESYRLAVANAR